MTILDRFLRYVVIDTTSNSKKSETPSTDGQRKLANLLVDELKDLNVDEIYYDEENCYVYAILRGNGKLPKIGFVSHLDTSEAENGKNIKPQIIYDYDGSDIWLNNEDKKEVAIYPNLRKHIGKTIITTDGTSLLGSDDKAGIAEIMNMLEYFNSVEEQHGDIYVCFTPDEEIGLGLLHFDKDKFSPDVAYTVDGRGVGEFSYDNFNAATAKITINGVSTHAGSAKDVMVNSIKIAMVINSLLPDEVPENTENYEGFFHLKELEGKVSQTRMTYLIRDFDKNNFENRKKILKTIVDSLNKKYNNCIKLHIEDLYYNMKEIVTQNEMLIENTLEAISNAGVIPEIVPIRGGTDGTTITYMGIPCPNLGTGGYNFHSIYEYACLEDMEKASQILIEIVRKYSRTIDKIDVKKRNRNMSN